MYYTDKTLGADIPFYVIVCLDCRIEYELGTERDLDPNGLICVDCASSRVNIQSTDNESASRLQNLVVAVAELAHRIENIEAHLSDESGSDDTSGTVKKTVN